MGPFLSNVMKDSPPLAKRRRDGAVFRAGVLHPASESRPAQVAARALGSNAKLRYKRQKETPTPAARRAAAEFCQLRAPARRQAQEPGILKKAIALFPVTGTPRAATAFPGHGGRAPRVAPRNSPSPTPRTPARETALVGVPGRPPRRYGTEPAYVARATAWGGSVCGWPRAGTAWAHSSPRPCPAHHRPAACVARPTDCSTSPSRPSPSRPGPSAVESAPLPVHRPFIARSSPVSGNWARRCAFQGLVSKQVLGWQVGASVPEERVIVALQWAWWSQPLTPGPVVHPERGGQCCGNAYRPLLHNHRAARSPRGAASPRRQRPGGKPAKGFGCWWSHLKTEVPKVRKRPVFADLAAAQAGGAGYFDDDNHACWRPSIGCQAPHPAHQ